MTSENGKQRLETLQFSIMFVKNIYLTPYFLEEESSICVFTLYVRAINL